jgi:hypothetical protein
LRGNTVNSAKSQGRQVRSFQLAAERVAGHPEFAAALIHKPGPLNDPQNDLEELAGVYRRGMAEVATLLADVTARPA